MKYEIFKSCRTKQWRWHLRAANGRLIACSGESYVRRIDCERAVKLVLKTTRATQIVQ